MKASFITQHYSLGVSVYVALRRIVNVNVHGALQQRNEEVGGAMVVCD